MISLQNYELFVDKRTSKSSSREYYALFIKIGDKEQLISFIQQSTYDYIVSLSE